MKQIQVILFECHYHNHNHNQTDGYSDAKKKNQKYSPTHIQMFKMHIQNNKKKKNKTQIPILCVEFEYFSHCLNDLTCKNLEPFIHSA